MQFEIHKAAQSAKASISDGDMELINAQALQALTPEEVFTFKVAACNDRIDRDNERFTVDTLQKLAPMFVGKTIISDHLWTASKQQARIYKTEVVNNGTINELIAHCYMLRNDTTKDVIAAICGGILKEVSVGCSIGRTVCSVCGKEAYTCQHLKGAVYDGAICHYELLDPVDAYELSFVAVPAQQKAGVIKSKNEHGWTLADMNAAKARLRIENERWK